MVRLPCCKQFQPKLTKEKYLYDCVQCDKYSMRCACGVINIFPPKSLKWRRLKPSCSYHIVHRECSKISSEEIKECIYKCNCDVEFEYEIEFGVKMFLIIMLITIATFNVNGLRDDIKRKYIFKYLLDCNFHITLLQETHSTSSIEHIWRKKMVRL